MRSFLGWSVAIVLLSGVLTLVAEEVVQSWLWHPTTRIGLLEIG